MPRSPWLVLLATLLGCPAITDVSPYASLAGDDDDSVSDDDDSVDDDDSAAGDDDDSTPVECDLSWIVVSKETVSFSAITSDILEVHCDPCHTFQAQGGLQMFGADAYDNLVNTPNQVPDGIDFSGMNRITPSDPENSYMLHKILGCEPTDPTWGFWQGPMPPATSGTPLSQEQISLIWSWVAQGAKAD